MNNTKTVTIAMTVIAVIIVVLFTGIIIQHPEVLRTTPGENPQFITRQETSVWKMAGVLMFIIVALALLGLKAATKENRKTI